MPVRPGIPDTIDVTLPQRPFSEPLARALVEQRVAIWCSIRPPRTGEAPPSDDTDGSRR